MKKFQLLFVLLSLQLSAFADIKVSDVQVFSGHPWKEVVIRYTITGSNDKADGIRVTATDRTANKTYVVESGSSALTGAGLSEGRHLLRWNAAAEGVKLASTNVVFAVSVVAYGGVQLWANGPFWAECNVGATKPEEYGYYFWWGDTVGYKRAASPSYWVSAENGLQFNFSEGNCPTHGKSVSQLQSAGYIDSTGNLTTAHDAATKHLGAPWRMPTDAEWAALISNCTYAWTKVNGVCGQLVTGKGAYASKSIFLPAAGNGYGYGLDYDGSRGDYWSSTPHLNDYDYSRARFLYFHSSYFAQSYITLRYCGQTVRPVRDVAQ